MKQFTILICITGALLSSNASAQQNAQSAAQNAATFPFNFEDGYTILHSNAKVPILVQNGGSAAITSLGYTVEDFGSGAVSNERTLTFDTPIAAGEQGEGTFRIPAGSTTGISQKIVTITRVNGENNEASAVDASANGYIHTLSEKVSKRTIEEEYTGTWCGYCPRGIVGMQLLEENYPDNYIGVAYHYSDALYISSNGYHDGFPQAILNRHANVDPYYGNTGNVPFGIEKSFLREQEILPEASLEMTAAWSGDAKTAIEVKSQLRFVYDSDDSYAMAYIVTESGMTAGSQTSYYGGDSEVADDPYMSEWYNGGGSRSIKYDHVAVASFGRENGIDESVSSPVTIGMEQEHSYTLDLSGAKTIQNKENLRVIAVLINRTTGTIINANSVKMHEAEDPEPPSALSALETTHQPVRYYSLDGRLINKPSTGLFLKR